MRDEPKEDSANTWNPEAPEAPNPIDTQPEVPTEQQFDSQPVEPFSATTNEPVTNPVDAPTREASEDNPLSQPASAPIGSGPEVVSAAPVAPGTDRKRKNLIKAAIVAGALLLLAGIGGSVYAFWYQNPEKVVTDALVNAFSAKTIRATGVLNVESSDGYKAKIEMSGRNSEEGNATVAVKFTIDSDDMSATVDGEGFFSKDGDIYVKLKDVQKLLDSLTEQSGGQAPYEAFSGVIKKVDGNWIKISKDDLKDAGEEIQTAQKCFADVTKSLSNDESFRKTALSETEKLYKENKFMIINKSLGSRDINGQGSLGYEIDADPEKVDAFFTGFASTTLGKKIKDCDSSIKFEDFVDEVTNESEAEGTAELWVSRFGHNITEANISSKSDTSTGSMIINPVFNKSEAVTAPTESISISEVIKDIEKAYEDALMQAYEDAYESSYQSSVIYN